MTPTKHECANCAFRFVLAEIYYNGTSWVHVLTENAFCEPQSPMSARAVPQ